jgi:hypothetical protein
MRKRFTILTLSCAAAACAAVTSAQQHNPKTHDHSKANELDTRILVPLPPELTAHMLANMRDHLVALQEIQQELSRGETDKAAKIAEHRLGMTSLTLHGAHEVAKFMPVGMQEAGSRMHSAASKFAVVAQDAGVTGDIKPAIAALAAVTAQCNACHAGYRVK